MGRRAKTPYIQINLGDRFLSLTDRGKKEILGSPLGYFGDNVFGRIPYQDFSVIYSENGQGPSNLIYLVAACMIMIQENITVDTLMLRIDSDVAIQYALHTTSMSKQPISRRNLFYFLAGVENYQKATGINLYEQCYQKLTAQNVTVMGLDKPSKAGRIKKRMDSLMVSTSAARLGGTGIVYTVNQDAVKLYVA